MKAAVRLSISCSPRYVVITVSKKPVLSCGQSFLCGLTDGNFLLFMIHPILKNPFHHDAMLEMMGVFLMTVVQLNQI